MTDLFQNHPVLIDEMRSAIKADLQRLVAQTGTHGAETLQTMLAYQMGWEGDSSSAKTEGKKIRPLLVTLAAEASGGNWKPAVPAASAVELIHNFSLIHDDIEDQSETRRGRPTVWKLWGTAQAINAGDAMFALANLALIELKQDLPGSQVLKAARVFHRTCLRLTQGQHLDLEFETLPDIPLESYWEMVGGKTAALLSCSCELGAICADTGPERREAFQQFGHYLGLAYQAQDDILGIWGEQSVIGKSTAGDLVSGKLTLPVIFGLTQDQQFRERWKTNTIKTEEVPELARRLEQIGARAYAQNIADRLTDLALNRLDDAEPGGKSGQVLQAVARTLLRRQT